MKKLFLIFNFSPARHIKMALALAGGLVIFNFSSAQPAIQWQKYFGGTSYDEAYSLQQTADGGFIVAGYTLSNNGSVIGNHDVTGQHPDCWIIKLAANGNMQWQKCLGGAGDEVANSVQQTADGGYIVAGQTDSSNGDVTGYHTSPFYPYPDYWLVKLDNSGNIQWQKCLGGTGDDRAKSVQQTTDGGYIVAGQTTSSNGDVAGLHSNNDYWLVKLDSGGNIQWQKCLGGTNDDYANSVAQTADGGYIVAGYTDSYDGDVTGNHGSNDFWLVKLDNSGNIQWQKCHGGTSGDLATSIQQTNDGGYVVAGITYSNNGEVTGNHSGGDYWIIKLNAVGNIQWQKCLGGTGLEVAYSVAKAADGGYIVAGQTTSNDGDVTGNHGLWDYWVVKLDSSGILQWQKCFGGTNEEEAYSVQQTTDGGYVVVGYAQSNDGDLSGNYGSRDFWIVKLAPYVGMEEESNIAPYNISPNPFTSLAVISFNRPLYNATLSLYNLLGEKVSEAANINGDSFEFSRGNLQSGVYFFEVSEKEKSIYRGKAVVY